MEISQIILFILIFAISLALLVIVIQLIGILHQAKETLKKLDFILDDLGFLSRSLTRGTSTISHLFTSLESGLQVVGMITKLVSSKSKK